MDSTGRTKLNSYSYDIFGNIVSQTENLPQPFKYSGEMMDDKVGLQYLRARWYDPSMGRFVGEDSYGGQVNNPLSLNRFTYVENNPLTHVDPTI
ncbi:RHS repeat-associated core domain-containing protein [Paenibacillus sp. SYP-B3998]|nr:RHS repeat-associated core domain-containing protein [Paenibacillus sp. SYP-B3998]